LKQRIASLIISCGALDNEINYPNLAQISRGLSKEKSENLKKIVTAAYTKGAA
jgi:hypothetical protein